MGLPIGSPRCRGKPALTGAPRAFSSKPELQKGIPKRACHVIHISPAAAGGDDGLAAGQAYSPDLRERVLAVEGPARSGAARSG